MKCPHCGRVLGCGCQRRTAKDGTQCCKYCVAEVNNEVIKRRLRQNLP